jgi:hypothetical protein
MEANATCSALPPLQPHAYSAGIVVVHELNARLLEGLLNPEQGRHISHRRSLLSFDPADRRFEAKFMLPWSFSEDATAEKHMAQLQHNMWVTNAKTAALSIITGGGKWVEITIPADALYQHLLLTAERLGGDARRGEAGLTVGGSAVRRWMSVMARPVLRSYHGPSALLRMPIEMTPMACGRSETRLAAPPLRPQDPSTHHET